MAKMNITHFSSVLEKQICMNVIIPDTPVSATLPVLYLLHGLSDNYTSWCSYSRIESFVRKRNVIIVMPDAGKSFYTDMANNGEKYYTYISREVPDFIEGYLPTGRERSKRFIAGLSMGGYGALKIGLSNPDRFRGIASFSGCCDIERLYNENTSAFMPVFGDNADITAHSLFHLAKTCGGNKPIIYQWCGTEDFLYGDNVKFKNYMQTLDFDYTYRESSGGHTWDLWDEQIEFTLKFFNLI